MKRITLLFVFISSLQLAYTQPGFLKNIKNSANNIIAGKPAISTNFKDVDAKNILPSDFGSDKTFVELSGLTKTSLGCYELEPGFYQTTNLSYCLKAGTVGPAKGDAYGLAPVEGKMSEIVEAILANSQSLWKGRKDSAAKGLLKTVAANAISQRDVQLLLWAIIAKADFENMQNKTKTTAVALLSPEQLFKLYGGAEKIIKKVAADRSGAVRTLAEIEGEIRRLFLSAATTYEDIERLAVLAGMAQEPNPFETGTWFLHKDGYYVRFEPQGYSRTTVKYYVPEGKKVCPVNTGYVATPSDSRQRLAQTDMSVEEYQRISLR